MATFEESIVNQRFRMVYDELEQRELIKGKSDIAKKLGTYNHIINSILKGQRNITLEQLHKLFENFNINANYLFGISEELFLDGTQAPTASIPARPREWHTAVGRQNITLVTQKAVAGYALEHEDKTFLESLQRFSIPDMEGELIAFEISGDSMLPTITNGDIVICEPLDSNTPLRENHVYVIVTDGVVAKRIQQIRKRNKITKLRLISDNDAVYKPYEIALEEVRQVLKVKCRLTDYAIS
ncbi:MAG TPA: S24 family peptidase [Saprospiraceae bacterium]|nr:S24 family peptidase [Saprospiraceae bacterium]HMQ84991.1 S24 family peptidase [Saprospiraceae bacterium]